MEKEEWGIQEYFPPEKNDGRLRRIWNSGLNLGKKIALTGIVVSAAPLALPPLVVLSAFGVAFSVPFGFVFASYAATDKLMSTLLPKPKPPPPPLLLRYEDVSSHYIEEEACEYDDEKVKEETYEENLNLLEEEVFEDDASKVFKVTVEVDEDNNIPDETVFSMGVCSQLGIKEDLKHLGEVIVDKVEQDWYEEDASEYMAKEEPTANVANEILKGIREAEEEISSMEDGRGEISGCGVEAVVVSAEVGGENDVNVEQVEEVDIVGPLVSIEDRTPKVKFGDVEPEELENETKGMIESIRDEGKTENKNPEHSIKKASPFVSCKSNEDVGDIKQFLEQSERETADDLVRLQNVSGPLKGKSGDAEPRESEREKMGIPVLEVTSDQDKIQDENLLQSMEKTSLAPVVSGEELKDAENLEQMKLPSETATADVFADLQKSCDLVARGEDNRRDDAVFSIKEEEKSGDASGPLERETADDLVRLQNVSGPLEEKSCDAELRELEREKKGIPVLEVTSDQDNSENENILQSTEKTSLAPVVSGEELKDAENLEQMKLPSETAAADVFADLQESCGSVTRGEDNKRNDAVFSIKEEIHDRRSNTMFSILDEPEPVGDIENEIDMTRDDKDLEGIKSEKQIDGTNHSIGMKGYDVGAIAVEKDHVCAKKLVLHVKKSGDHKAADICEETDLNTRGETLIFTSADMRGSATESGFDMLGEDNSTRDHHSQPADDHLEGIGIIYGDMPDANLHDYEHPSSAGELTSKPVEGSSDDYNTWKQINAMRAILGYEAASRSSCVEELRALYVFTGVEPPSSIKEPSSAAYIDEKLEFLMAIVGVKK